MSDRAQEIAEELLCRGDRRIKFLAEVQRARDEERAKCEADIEHFRAAWRGAEAEAQRWHERHIACYADVARLRALVEQCRDALVSWQEVCAAKGERDMQTDYAIAAADEELGR